MSLEQIEISLLLEGVFRHYGYDFRQYAPAALGRWIARFIASERLSTVSGLQERMLHDPACMQRFVATLSVPTTTMFRDPEFYVRFRREVVPLLRTYPFVRIWHAGCASGQEVYSMAVLLHEEGLYDRCRLYATDLSGPLLVEARAGMYPVPLMQEYTAKYLQAGGKRAFSEYYRSEYEHAVFHPWLGRNIVWAEHNLASDGVFNTFHVILCRNVMIYFSRPLQDRVHHLLYESLETLGILGLGNRESLHLSPLANCYEELGGGVRLYRKVR